MASAVYEPLYLRGVELFNTRRFFACHDAWEELWIQERGSSRQFYKGLIQAAVALHHLTSGNPHGAGKLLTSSQKYLDPYRPTHLGLDVDQLLTETSACFHDALAEEETGGVIKINPRLLPTIRLRPSPTSAAL